MKKLLCILTISFLFISTGYTQEQPKQDESSAVTEVVDKVFDRTTQAIQELADVLKVPAEKVYSILVKQQVVKAVTLVIVDVIIVAFLLTFTVRIWKWAKQCSEDSGGGSYFVALVMTEIPFIVVFCSLQTVVMGLINPEYGAIKEILTFIS